MADTINNRVVVDSVRNILVGDDIAIVVQVGSEDVFGVTSTISTPEILYLNSEYPLTESVVFQSIALLLFILYFTIIRKNIEDVALLFSNISLSQNSNNSASGIKSGYRHTKFLYTMQLLGFAFVGLYIVKCAELIADVNILSNIPDALAAMLVPIIVVLSTIIVVYQVAMLSVVAWITLTKEFIEELIALKVALFSIFVVVVSPILLLYVLSPQEKGSIWRYTIMILVVLSIILHLIKSIRLFISKKIPILQWFLYLCCVEFIPISCIGVIITRY